MAETNGSTVQAMLSEFLTTFGFTAMARDVLGETEPARLRHYARIVLRQCPPAQRQHVHSRFVMLRLV